jgi:hypothetical protein
LYSSVNSTLYLLDSIFKIIKLSHFVLSSSELN